MAKTKGKNSAKQDIINRVRVLYAIFIFVGLCVAARLVWVQYFSPSVKHNAKIMEKGVFRETDIPAHRGAILTREGEPLALSSIRYNVTIDFAAEGLRNASPEEFEKNVSELSELLAQHFSKEDAARNGYKYISAEQYRDIFYKNNASRKERALKILPRTITLDEWRMMKRSFPIFNHSLGYVYDATDVDERVYPSGDLARQIIGRYKKVRVKTDTLYGWGLELLYNNDLAGHNGVAVEQRIAHGFWTRVNDPKNKMPEDGCNIITTLDAGMQRMATERLRKKLEEEEASFGVALVMEVETGNILSIVNLSTGKERGTNFNERVYNHAMLSVLSPGSTMKLASAMALMELGGYTPNTTVKITSKREKVGSRIVVDDHDITPHTGTNVTLRDGFAHSSNLYFAKAIFGLFKDNPEVYTQYLDKLGYNGYMGLEAYGAKRGIVPQPGTAEFNRHGSSWVSIPGMAFGYVVAVPPIHTLTFYNGVANGGKLVAPRFVDRIERNGEVVERMPVVTLNEKMCSEQTLSGLYELLEAAAAPERTRNKFVLLPVKFGCKTGTAQISGTFQSEATKDRAAMSKGYLNKNDNYYLGSIVTMMPLDKPKYTVMVCVAKQMTTTHPFYAGISVAGDVANDIMEYICQTDPTLHPTIEPAVSPYSPKSIKAGEGGAVRHVTSRLTPYNIDLSDASAWSSVNIDNGGNAHIEEVVIAEGIVPDVAGMGLSDALYLLERTGLNVSHEGSGAVATQSIAAGTVLDGTIETIHLTLRH